MPQTKGEWANKDKKYIYQNINLLLNIILNRKQYFSDDLTIFHLLKWTGEREEIQHERVQRIHMLQVCRREG